ncbi:MAG: hypothetical protein WA126_03170 [Thermodesulfovibrionales bacterium]
MSAYDDVQRYQEEEAMERFIEEQLREIAEAPVFSYLSKYGDAIEERIRYCIEEATALRKEGFWGAALIRSAAAIEIAIRFYLARPLVQGAFLSDEWAALLSKKVLSGRTAEDRDLLPAILRNWSIDITKVLLSNNLQMWQQVTSRVWPRRNDYVHAGDTVEEADAVLAAECLDALLSHVVDPIARRLGFTREQTGCWSVVTSPIQPEINSPRRYLTANPFDKEEKKEKG